MSLFHRRHRWVLSLSEPGSSEFFNMMDFINTFRISKLKFQCSNSCSSNKCRSANLIPKSVKFVHQFVKDLWSKKKMFKSGIHHISEAIDIQLSSKIQLVANVREKFSSLATATWLLHSKIPCCNPIFFAKVALWSLEF
jgi:hypothetical protein